MVVCVNLYLGLCVLFVVCRVSCAVVGVVWIVLGVIRCLSRDGSSVNCDVCVGLCFVYTQCIVNVLIVVCCMCVVVMICVVNVMCCLLVVVLYMLVGVVCCVLCFGGCVLCVVCNVLCVT